MKQKHYLFHSIFMINSKNNISAGDVYVRITFFFLNICLEIQIVPYIYLENRDIFPLFVKRLHHRYRRRRFMQKNLLYFVGKDKLTSLLLFHDKIIPLYE